MASGILLGALGGFSELVFMVCDHAGCPIREWSAASWTALFTGLLAFSAGFVVQAAKSHGVRARIAELEAINLAQAGELDQLRNR